MISPRTINNLMQDEDADKYYKVIAQADDEDWEESGYVVVYDVVENQYAIGRYSHCSGYGTWTSLQGGDYSDSGGDGEWDWVGSKDELLNLAKNNLDPDMPERKADPEDYDYNHLINVYQQVLGELK